MFLHRLLDPDARRAFAGLAYYLLHLGDVSAREARTVYTMLGELALGVEELTPTEPFEQLAARIVHPRARLASLLELVRLARIDRELSPEELEILRWLAGVWSIGAPELLAVLDWVERFTALQREAESAIDRAR
ncbi:MAG TPA: hypothetical protein PLU22_19750 [Polyangiaceae bacterium]|nr:hypothetical protein [Polyangiaceae bacterium]